MFPSENIDELLNAGRLKQAYKLSKKACVESLCEMGKLCFEGSSHFIGDQGKAMLRKGMQYITDALKMDPFCIRGLSLAVKITGALNDLPALGVLEQRRATDQHLEFIERYLELEPEDYRIRYFRAQCCFSILNAPRLLRPLYRFVFFHPPTRTLEEIIVDFEEVQRIVAVRGMVFLENEYYLALSYLKKGETSNAVRCLETIEGIQADTAEQKQIKEKARRLLLKYTT
ncbi:hypothetical protein QR680_005837 [Steinernema hermaphroditum]|uniref:Uncharacterized protein n=1 Tax=Steinernema hermaphroditum TaxID=289476 RepID=A0AA39HTG6_9BILA|nr:hypothetical protein QR680_005837 [Steinernema hermaphroditum]